MVTEVEKHRENKDSVLMKLDLFKVRSLLTKKKKKLEVNYY